MEEETVQTNVNRRRVCGEVTQDVSKRRVVMLERFGVAIVWPAGAIGFPGPRLRANNGVEMRALGNGVPPHRSGGVMRA